MTVTIGTHSHGQGHEITFAQIVADLLGLEPHRIRIRYGDTDLIEHGTGTFGSRSVVAGSVVLTKTADRIIARGKKIAAAHLEVSADDVRFENGHFEVVGTDRRVSLPDVARLAYVLNPADLDGELGLAAKMVVAPAQPTFPNGCHVCEVEVDPRDRPLRHRPLLRGGRRRARGQSDAGRRADPWRRGAGPRPSAAGEHRL